MVLLVYSMDNNDSFQAISSNWLDNISSATDDSSLTVLVGNKCDVQERQEELEEFVSRRRALTLAGNLEIQLDMVFEISALTGKGFQEMFDGLAVRMREMMADKPPPNAQQNLGCDTRQKSQCRC